MRIDGRKEKVRLIGIDTPETKKPDTPVQCFGPEASAYTAALVPVGTKVHLERDAEARDVYGRLLAYVYRADDGLFVNLDVIRHSDGRIYLAWRSGEEGAALAWWLKRLRESAPFARLITRHCHEAHLVQAGRAS